MKKRATSIPLMIALTLVLMLISACGKEKSAEESRDPNAPSSRGPSAPPTISEPDSNPPQ